MRELSFQAKIRQELRALKRWEIENGHLSPLQMLEAELHLLDNAHQGADVANHLADCEYCRNHVQDAAEELRQVREREKEIIEMQRQQELLSPEEIQRRRESSANIIEFRKRR